VAEGGGLLNLIAPCPPVPFGLTVCESVDVFPFSHSIVSRLNTLVLTSPVAIAVAERKAAGIGGPAVHSKPRPSILADEFLRLATADATEDQKGRPTLPDFRICQKHLISAAQANRVFAGVDRIEQELLLVGHVRYPSPR
jgi:hypothetical protein